VPEPRIVFCGVGALGSTAAVLCRSLGAELRLVDFDRVESKNLSAQAYVKQSLGKNKAEALKQQLWNFWAIKAEALPVRVTADNVAQVCAGASLLVDCFDNRAGREVLSAHARATGLPLVHAALAADGRFGLCRWADQATCEGGEHLPFIGLLAAALARAIQEFVARGVRKEAIVSLSGVQVL
jgi:molybdopterin/thiamine biosynthesis adenylyltransferase